MPNKKPSKKISLPQPADGVWYAEGLKFGCTQCGNCCSGGPGFVWVTIDDLVNIAGFLQMDVEAFSKTYVRRIHGALSLIEKRAADYDCIFLKREDGKAMCGIYPVRPTQCRTWPFWNQNLNSPQAWENAAENCPGMRNGKGKSYDFETIEAGRLHPESP
jgi:Fe-S-cluster containining protein